jgi:MFS family permease
MSTHVVTVVALGPVLEWLPWAVSGTRLVQLSWPQTVMGWLGPVVAITLLLAAFLHWRLSRHWSLLVLAIASLCLVLCYASLRIGEMSFAYGSERAIQPLIALSGWLTLAGAACALIGAIGSIWRALKLSRQVGCDKGDITD